MQNQPHKSPDLTGCETYVMDFSKPGEPNIYTRPPEKELVVFEIREDCIMVEKVNINQ